jgi:hypothetical protein
LRRSAASPKKGFENGLKNTRRKAATEDVAPALSSESAASADQRREDLS